jgi:hypothetical protein
MNFDRKEINGGTNPGNEHTISAPGFFPFDGLSLSLFRQRGFAGYQTGAVSS